MNHETRNGYESDRNEPVHEYDTEYTRYTSYI